MTATIIILAIFSFQDERDQGSFKLSFADSSVEDYIFELTSIISNRAICKELEIVDSQAKRIRKGMQDSNKKYMQDFNEGYRPLVEKGEQQAATVFHQKLMREHTNRITEILNDELLPHQLKKTERMVYWSLIRSNYRDYANGSFKFQSRFQDEAIRKILKIDSRQTKQITTKVTSLQNEFHKELAELHDKYEKLVAKELRKDQQQLNKRILGKTPSFLFKSKESTTLPNRSTNAGGIF